MAGRQSTAQGISGCHTAGHVGISEGALRRDFTVSPKRGEVGERGLEEKGLELSELEQGSRSSHTHSCQHVRTLVRCTAACPRDRQQGSKV